MSEHHQATLRGGGGGNRNPPPNRSGVLRTATRLPVRKLRIGGAVGLGVALLLPLVNAAMRKLGLPSLTADDLRSAWDLGLAAYGSVAAIMAWAAAYLARPSAEDAPVQDFTEAG